MQKKHQLHVVKTELLINKQTALQCGSKV